MRIVAMSDTHGQLSYVNDLAKKHQADAVIHCGDFGFMTHDTVDTYPERELSLNIKHWPFLPMEIRKQAWKLSREDKIEIIREHEVLGDFDLYLQGSEQFDVPLYAIWGNHEDIRVIRSLFDGEYAVENLNLVTSRSTYELENIILTGIGGNMAINHFFELPYSGSFYPYMTFQEWAEVRYTIKKARSKDRDLWFQTHVSPGKHPLLEQFGMHLDPKLWFSGHMGAPFPQHYSLFTHLDDWQFVSRVATDLKFTVPLWEQYKEEVQLWLDLKQFMDEHLEDQNFPDTFEAFMDKMSPKAELFEEMEKDAKRYFRAKTNGHKYDARYPSNGKFQFLKAAERLFQTPIEQEEEIDTLKEYTSRKSAKWVRRGYYFNLPDVYTGGYVVIDMDTASNQHTIQAFGAIT